MRYCLRARRMSLPTTRLEMAVWAKPIVVDLLEAASGSPRRVAFLDKDRYTLDARENPVQGDDAGNEARLATEGEPSGGPSPGVIRTWAVLDPALLCLSPSLWASASTRNTAIRTSNTISGRGGAGVRSRLMHVIAAWIGGESVVGTSARVYQFGGNRCLVHRASRSAAFCSADDGRRVSGMATAIQH